MTKRIGMLLLAGLIVGHGAAAAWADDLGAAEKQICQAWEKQRSMTAKLTMVSNIDAGGTMMEGKGEGTIEYVHKGDKTYLRMELKSTMPQPVGADTKTEQNMLTIIDGDYAWTLSETMGQKMAMKTKIDLRTTGDPKTLFAEYRKDYELKLLPDDTVDGKKTYVIEATQKEKAGGNVSRTLLYFDKDNGGMLKMAVQTPDGKPTMTMSYSDVKYDVNISPDRFVFKAPPGVEVQDLTKVEPAQPAAAEKPAKPNQP